MSWDPGTGGGGSRTRHVIGERISNTPAAAVLTRTAQTQVGCSTKKIPTAAGLADTLEGKGPQVCCPWLLLLPRKTTDSVPLTPHKDRAKGEPGGGVPGDASILLSTGDVAAVHMITSSLSLPLPDAILMIPECFQHPCSTIDYCAAYDGGGCPVSTSSPNSKKKHHGARHM